MCKALGPISRAAGRKDRKTKGQNSQGQRFSPAVWFGRPRRWRGARPLGKGMGAAGRGARLLSCLRRSWPHSSWVVLLTMCPWGQQRIRGITGKGCRGHPPPAQGKNGKKYKRRLLFTGIATIRKSEDWQGGSLTGVHLSMSWGPWGLILHLSGSLLYK